MIAQGSPEWHMQRLGKVTASKLADMLARTQKGWGASRANYLAELVAARLTGVPTVSFANDAMRWGTETEPQARAAYEFFTDHSVCSSEFEDHPTIPMSGASPDGHIGADGLIEIKCPNTATHIDTLLGGGIPERYRVQMQWQMACTNRVWCDFVSFDPRMPGNMQLFIKRLDRDDVQIANLEKEVTLFLGEVSAKVDALKILYGMEKAA